MASSAAIENAKGIPPNIKFDETDLVDRIKKSLDQRKYSYGRTMFGLILQRRGLWCVGGRYILRRVKDVLGEAKFKDFLGINRKVSLIFTVDTTRSMSQEIPQVRALAKRVKTYSKRNNMDYVLSTYNDAVPGMVKTFSKKNSLKFLSAIGKLSTAGGGDCSEPTFEGIINAIDKGNAHSSSPLYVFTDSPSKPFGYRGYDAALSLAKNQLVGINFFFSASGCANPGDDQFYQSVVDQTGGLSLYFSSPWSLYRAVDVVKAGLDGIVIIKAGRFKGDKQKKTSKESQIKFQVDKSINRLIISILGESNSSAVNLMDSNGNQIPSNQFDLINSQLWIIEAPSNGTWILDVNRRINGFSYVIQGSSNTLNVGFDVIFLRRMQHNNQQVKIPNPLRGEKATAKVIIPNLSRLRESTLRFYLVNKDGELISPLFLNQENSVSFDLPAQNSFRILINGSTANDENFMRTSKLITPSKAILRTQIEKGNLAVKRGRFSHFRAVIDYASERPRLFRLAGYSFVRGIKLTIRRTITVRKSRPGYIPVFVVTRAKVSVGTVARIHIIATSHDVVIHLLESVMVT